MNSFKSERRKQHSSSAALNPVSTFGTPAAEHTPSTPQEQAMTGLHAGYSLADLTIHRPDGPQSAQPSNVAPLQMVDEAHSQGQPIQAVSDERKDDKTGLPVSLKAEIESSSGISLDDIRVHYDSSKPAEVGALAYAQGTEIYVGPGQETHLPHEAWHVVQQRQGRVKPTMQAKGLAINDDQELEREADVMGAKAVRDAAGNGH